MDEAKAMLMRQYNSFKSRVKQLDCQNNSLLLGMWCLLSLLDVSSHGEYMLYWPKENPASFVGIAHTCVDNHRCLKPPSNTHLYMIVPVVLINKHFKQQQQRQIFTNCTSSNDMDYCYLAHKVYDHEEWLPLKFVTTLYNGTINNNNRKRGPSTVETIVIAPLFTKPIHFHHLQLFDALYVSPDIASQYEQRLSDYDATIVSHFTSYYDNNDFKHGFTLSGSMTGPFCIKMNRIHGVVGVHPMNAATPPTSYKLLVSSRYVTLATDYANRDAVRLLPHQRKTRITVLNNSHNNLKMTEISYHRLDTAGGIPLRSIATNEEWVMIESNDSLLLVFGDRSNENTGFFSFSNVSGEAACKFNISYADIFMWYDEGVASLPYRMQIEMTEFMTQLFGRECRNYLMNAKIEQQYDIEDAKRKNADEWVNSEFDEKGSMHEYFSRINLLAHTKICDAPNSPTRLPEFYLFDRSLAVNKLRATRCRTERDDMEMVPVVVSKSGRHLNDWVRVENMRTGGLFLYQKPLALFKVDPVQKIVSFTPLGVAECFEIIEHIVYT